MEREKYEAELKELISGITGFHVISIKLDISTETGKKMEIVVLDHDVEEGDCQPQSPSSPMT